MKPRAARHRSARRQKGAAGFILVEALVSAAVAGLAAALAILVLVTVAGQLERAAAERGAAQLTRAVYEEARLTPAAQLKGAATGQVGRYAWLRTGGGALSPDLPDSPVKVRIDVRWTVHGRPYRHGVQAVIAPTSTR